MEKDQNSDTPLHAIVRTNRKDKIELLLVLMVHSDYGTEEIDFPAMYGNTALHLAVHVRMYVCMYICGMSSPSLMGTLFLRRQLGLVVRA